MRKCCCCIPVIGGAVALGVIGILICLAELVVIVPYLMELDEFNPIKDNLENIYYVVQQMMEENQIDK